MTNKKGIIKSLSIAMVVVMLGSAGLLIGCTANNEKIGADNEPKNNDNAIVEQDDQSKNKTDIDAFLKSSPEIDAVIAYMDQNISRASKENASYMLLQFEDLQKKELPKLEGKYFNGQKVQQEMLEAYTADFDLNKLGEIKDEEAVKLLQETKSKGYKVETAEGMFFPVIDYEFYKKYSSYVSEDIKEYIDVMAVESNKTPIKDAGLMIGWDEIAKRVLKQEKFVEKYADSVRFEEIRQLQERYATFLLYGSNNTPLFSYETKVMVPKAQAAYIEAIKENLDSKVLKMLNEYLVILSKTGYKISVEAESFRNEVIEKDLF